MEKIAIMIDANSGIDEIEGKDGIYVVRSGIHFGSENYIDGLTMTSEQFYKKLESDLEVIPSTSMPPIGEVLELVESLIKKGYTHLIHFPISYELSGTGPAIEALIPEFEDKINLVVFNTRAASYPQAMFALNAKKMIKEGKTFEEIIKDSERIRDNSHAYFVVNDLRYLVKNGRLSGASGFLGSMLKLKPLLELTDEGKIVSIEKIRTRRKALTRLVEKVHIETSKYTDVEYVILHGNDLEGADLTNQLLNEKFGKEIKCEKYFVSPAVGAHVGAGLIGVAYLIR